MAEQGVPGVDPHVQQQTEAFRRDYRAVKAEIGKAAPAKVIEASPAEVAEDREPELIAD